ncbi:hypothetical protein GX51_06280 [Blastomyces parvus]|uniref:Uncharacterized protein n=1 Tax=Blastomyces parvus TaxID=2060905 RepID=A0A2B7WSV2_9EURO|nr:hypothetical protein GX51_06280 [Blastomyces parvus]
MILPLGKSISRLEFSNTVDWDQVWFLHFKEMKSPSFTQLGRKFADLVSAGLSQTTINKLLDLAPDNKYQFRIHSPSMLAAVQLLNDKSNLCYMAYCETNPIVEMMVHLQEEQSPNTSCCPSSQASLAQHRKVSGKQNLSEFSPFPPLPAVPSHLDVPRQIR